MANQLAEMPWKIDTPQAGAFFLFEVDVVHFEFSDYTLDTDTVTVKNRNGQIVWTGNGGSDLRPVISQRIGTVNGLIIDQLSSGKLLIYFK